MELDPTSDQELFVETTRRFLQAESPLTTVRDLHEDPVGFTRTSGAGRGAWPGLASEGEDRGGGSISGLVRSTWSAWPRRWGVGALGPVVLSQCRRARRSDRRRRPGTEG